MSVSARAALTPRTIPAKNGSEKNRDSGSETTSAIESARRVTRLRAARLGTYPSLATARSTWARTSALTRGEPLTTRDTVARETPASAATCSSVGGVPGAPGKVTAEGSGEPQGGAPVDRSEGSGEPQGGAPEDRSEGSGEPQGGAPVDREGSV